MRGAQARCGRVVRGQGGGGWGGGGGGEGGGGREGGGGWGGGGGGGGVGGGGGGGVGGWRGEEGSESIKDGGVHVFVCGCDACVHACMAVHPCESSVCLFKYECVWVCVSS